MQNNNQRTSKHPRKGIVGFLKACTPKQKILLVILAFIVVLLVWIVGSVAYEITVNGEYYAYRYSGEEQRFTPLEITFAPADFDADIYENEGYMAKNRYIHYITGAQASDIAPGEDGAYYGREFVFLQQYLQCLINGDVQAYPGFFTADYAEDEGNLPIPAEPFTPQMLYDISIDYRTADTVYVSRNEAKKYFIVKYAIYQNNGTFRPDLQTDTVIPLLFEITETGNDLKISKIIKYIG